MPDQSSIRTVIVLEFNPAEGLIDSEIIAVRRIVSNTKKNGRAGGWQGAKRAVHVAPSTDDGRWCVTATGCRE